VYGPSLKLPEFGLTMLCPLLAQSRHAELRCKCPLLGVKRTCHFALHMSAYDPKQTSGPQPETAQTIVGSHLASGINLDFRGSWTVIGFIPSRQGHCISCVWASDGH
jgi:hypothetical protein